jgi:hypothetical protein
MLRRSLLAVALLVAPAGAAVHAQTQPRPGDEGRELTQKAKSAARDVNELLDELRKKIDTFSRSSDPGAGAELDAIDAYVTTAKTIKKHCDEYLAEEPRLGERFTALRAAYDKAIDFFKKAEDAQRAKVSTERANVDIPEADRERNAKMRERYAGLYAKNRTLLEAEKAKVDGWEREMKKKFLLLRAKSRLLERAIDTAGLMRAVAANETETRAFVDDVKKLNAVLDQLLEDIAKSQLHEDEPAPAK